MTLGMLSAVARKEGWQTKAIVNTFNKPYSVAEFVQEAINYKADIVGISMITFEVNFVYELIRKLKKAKLNVIVGGAHPTDCPEECIKAGADAVVIGEGEEILKDILKEYPNIKKGIRDRKPYLELDKLPLPDLDIFDKETFTDEEGFMKGFHRIYTSRGCPGCCTFCDWQVFKQCWRPYPTQKIIADIKRRKKEYGINSFSIADDCFTVDRERAIELSKEFKKLGIIWRTNSRANLVDQELLNIFKDCGCHSIAFGLESGDPETLQKIGKMVMLEQNIQAPKMAHKAGLEVYGCLMTGFPWETPKSVENQIKFIHELWDDVSLFQVSGSLMPFPGTAIYRLFAKEYGFEKYWLKPEYQKFGIQVYQNAINPFSVSTFYQRYMFDDTYIQEEKFFKYTKEYKQAVKKLVWEIGRHNLRFMFPNQDLRPILLKAKLSMMLYNLFPNLERKIGGTIYKHIKGRSKIEKVRDKRRGITKTYDNPN